MTINFDTITNNYEVKFLPHISINMSLESFCILLNLLNFIYQQLLVLLFCRSKKNAFIVNVNKQLKKGPQTHFFYFDKKTAQVNADI
jgi:hypothetical protein